MQGKLLVTEGLDGSGLSTQALMLRNKLLEIGKEVVLTKEPTDSIIGGLIKSSLKEELKTSSLALQFLFVADRAHHLSAEIEPSLKEGKFVISDRYLFSTLAFGSLDIDIEFLKTINSKFRLPDLTFIIDVSPEICLQRIKLSRASHLELFEKKEKMQKIRNAYHSLKNQFPNIYIINGERSKEQVSEEIWNIVKKLI